VRFTYNASILSFNVLPCYTPPASRGVHLLTIRTSAYCKSCRWLSTVETCCLDFDFNVLTSLQVVGWFDNTCNWLLLLLLSTNLLKRTSLRVVGWNSSVSIAMGYGLGNESWWRRDFLHRSRPALEPTQPPIQCHAMTQPCCSESDFPRPRHSMAWAWRVMSCMN
jgi:hypothetical protein